MRKKLIGFLKRILGVKDPFDGYEIIKLKTETFNLPVTYTYSSKEEKEQYIKVVKEALIKSLANQVSKKGTFIENKLPFIDTLSFSAEIIVLVPKKND